MDEEKLLTLLDFAEKQNFERLGHEEDSQIEIEEAISEIRKAIAEVRLEQIQERQANLDKAIAAIKR